MRVNAETLTVGLRVRLEAKSAAEAHLSGWIAAALGEYASTLLAVPPVIGRIDVLAAKLP
jgi:hypothetical protein